MIKGVLAALRYIKARLKERSTYAGIGLAIASANAFVPPWDIVGIAVGVIAVFIPTTEEEA